MSGEHRVVEVAGRTFANDQPMVLIGGINVLESAELAIESAAEFRGAIIEDVHQLLRYPKNKMTRNLTS